MERCKTSTSAPFVLLEASAMARATLDPGGVQIIEAYLRRFSERLAQDFDALEPFLAVREDSHRSSTQHSNIATKLAATAQLLAECDATPACAAQIVLRQSAATGGETATGGELATCWCFDAERRKLSARFKEVAPLSTLYQQFLSDADRTIHAAKKATSESHSLSQREQSSTSATAARSEEEAVAALTPTLLGSFTPAGAWRPAPTPTPDECHAASAGMLQAVDSVRPPWRTPPTFPRI